MAKMTPKQFERSAIDKRMDSRKGAPKEGSKADRAADKKALDKVNKGNLFAKGFMAGKRGK
jgi:hypothetical protein